MNPDFQRLMQEATRLTRGGDLTQATALIQQALQSEGAAVVRPDAPGPDAHEAIVIEAGTEVASTEPVPNRTADFVAPHEPETAWRDVFIAGRAGTGRSGRDYKLYIPPAAGSRPLPLVLMLHGCTQTPDDFAAGTRMNELAREQNCFVLYPAQSLQANQQRCWNWFKHTHQQRDRGEPAMLAALTLKVMAQYDVDPAKVYVAGLSAGGAMASILGVTHPDLFSAVGVHSGLAAGSARDLPSALAAMRGGAPGKAVANALPTIVFHGDADKTVHMRNGELIVAAVAGSGGAESHQQQDGTGRRYTRHVHRATSGRVLAEHWVVHGSGHAWSGGSPQGSYTDAGGPDASREMLRFFLEHARTQAWSST